MADTSPDYDYCPVTGKVRHRHRSAAASALKRHRLAANANGRRREPMNAFRCRHCGGWHCGGWHCGNAPGKAHDGPGVR